MGDLGGDRSSYCTCEWVISNREIALLLQFTRIMSKYSLTKIEAFLPISATLATSGQPKTDQFAWIRAAGYRAIVNLATSASSNWNPDEPVIVTQLGMEYKGIPIEWENPTINDFEALMIFLKANEHQLTWVHCAKNMRVSAMIYLYHRLYKGYTDTEATHYLEQIWQPNQIWQDFIATTLATYPKPGEQPEIL
jgi:protein tyrosine phosphatase (PTP) superfamily phosphohydrolase (DUF442 family)